MGRLLLSLDSMEHLDKSSSCLNCGHGEFVSRSGNPGTRKSLKLVLGIAFFVLFVSCNAEDLQCMPGIHNFAGVTIPHGDIYLAAGESLQIYCKMNATHPKAQGLNSSNIVFSFTKPANFDSSLVRTQIINETTALMTVNQLKASKYYVRCELEKAPGNKIPVCQNEVLVGYEPKEPTDFRCVSKNWTKLECTWSQVPELENPIAARYNLTFQERWRLFQCPHISNRGRNWNCTWSEVDEHHYRQNEKELNIVLTGYSKLYPAGVTWRYTIDHFSIVIPEPAIIEDFVARSPRQLYLRWSFKKFEYFNDGLQHEITVSNSEAGYENTTFLVTNKGKGGEASTVIDVPFAYTDYTVTIRMRSRTANRSDDTLWSQPVTNWTATLPEKPESPQVNIGSFEVAEDDQERVVTVYWENISPHKRNGPNFRYYINLSTNGLTEKKFNTTESHFKYVLKPGKEYTVRINSVNDIGFGPNESIVTIPATASAPPKVKSVTLVNYLNGSAEVVWTPTSNFEYSYTVFRCLRNIQLQQCDLSSPFTWNVVNAGEGHKMYFDNVENVQLYSFAVSTNTDKLSSGMVWQSCYLDAKKPVKPGKVSVADKSRNQVIIKWEKECSYVEGYMDGYEIKYCRIASNNSSGPDAECKNSNRAFANDKSNFYTIKNLTSKTTYKITVSVQNKFNTGERETIMVQTLSAEPSDPPQLEVVEIFNTSVKVRVTPPKIPNGKIVNYKFYTRLASSSNGQVETKTLDVKTEGIAVYTIPHLESNAKYSIEAAACNPQGCSNNNSAPVYFTTKEGATQMREPPQLSYGNGIIKINWKAPTHAGGKIEAFELFVLRNGEEIKEALKPIAFQAGIPEYNQEIALNCDLNSNMTAQVRAITLTEDGQELVGNWSQEGSVACVGAGGHIVLIICILAVVAVILIALIGKKTYVYYKECRDVGPRLPPGIEKELYPCNHVQKRKAEVIGDKDSMMSFPPKYQNEYHDDQNGVLPSFKYTDESKISDTTFEEDRSNNSAQPVLGFTELNSVEASDLNQDSSVPWLWPGVPSDESMPVDSSHTTETTINLNNISSISEDWPKGAQFSASVLNPLLPPANRSISEDCNPRSNSSLKEPYTKLGMFSSKGGDEDSENQIVLNDLPLSSNPSSEQTFADQISSPSSSSASSTSSTTPTKTFDSNIVPDVITTNNAPYVRWNQISDIKHETLIPSTGNYCQVGMF